MKILVVGDSCTDVMVYGKCNRLCPEGPVPVFNPMYTNTNPGMASNVARNIEALGKKCDTLLTTDQIIKRRYIEEKSNQLLLRVDENDKSEPIQHLPSYKDFDAIVVSDYDKGFLSITDIMEITNQNPNVFIDTKKPLKEWVNKVKFIKINHIEYEKTKYTVTGEIRDKLIITMGEDGCMYKGKHYPAVHKSKTIDISGAGDTFLAAFVVKYTETKNIEKAISFAQECTSKVIKKRGVSTV